MGEGLGEGLTVNTDVDSDGESLLDMFWAVPHEVQAKMLLAVAQAACESLLSNSPRFAADWDASKDGAQFLEAVLWKCMPRFPWEWPVDSHWPFPSMEEIFRNAYTGGVAKFVFAPEYVLDRTAAVLADGVDLHANQEATLRDLGQEFEEDELEGLRTDVDSMKRFLLDWKEAFYEVIREQQQVSDTRRLIACMPRDTIVTDLWDWDIRFEEESFGDIEEAAFCDEELFASFAEQLADNFERWCDEYDLDYNQNEFDRPEDFSAFVKEECLKFMKEWRSNVRAEFGR